MKSLHVNRRCFMTRTTGGLALFATPLALASTTPSPHAPQVPASQPAAQAPVPERPPALAADLVREFVTKAHADLSATKALLAKQPALLNATWDWGGGDFETAIGGAGHMGNRDIAEFLIGQGARFDIFVAAMLGQIDVLRPALTRWPDLVNSKGPHGISLLRHAKAGGPPAGEVVAYLVSKGAA